MTRTIRLLSSTAVVFVALILSACGHNESRSERGKQHSSIDELRTELDSGTSLRREQPFNVRLFKPYIGEDWIGYAVSYGCYRRGQAPGHNGPSKAEILEDLNIITRNWNLIRVYSADDDTKRILQVIRKHGLPVKVMLGIWLEPEENDPEHRIANVEQVLQGVALANLYTDVIAAVSVGNETQVFWSGHLMNPRNLVRYIRAVRNNSAVPVTTADDYNFWNKPESRLVADEIDFVVSHIYPLWNGKTLENAVEWMDQIYREVQHAHPEKMVVIGETGWATDYNPDKTGPGEQGALIKGKVGLAAQGDYLIQLGEWVNSNQIPTFLFEAFDEPWKGGGEQSAPHEIEKHWGVYYEDRTPKESFLDYLEHNRDKLD